MNKKYLVGLLSALVSIIIFLVFFVLISSKTFNRYTTQIITLGGINVIIALSLNLITGFTGQLALGHAGFMAIGAYSSAYFLMNFNFPLPLAILCAGFVTALFGLIIGFPTLKLSGDYLAIVTLGFGEIIRVIIVNATKITGGAAGLKGIPAFSTSRSSNSLVAYSYVFIVMFIVVFALKNLIKSSHGRAIVSIREDEIASNSMGVNTYYYKMFAFVLSAFIAGIGGGLYAPFISYLSPSSFTFLKSVEFLIIVVLGGMGSITGTIIAGFSLTYLQEALRFLQNYRMVIYPIILILMMLFRPIGIMGTKEITIEGMLNYFGFSKKKHKKVGDK